MNILHRNVCLSEKIFWKLPVQKKVGRVLAIKSLISGVEMTVQSVYIWGLKLPNNVSA